MPINHALLATEIDRATLGALFGISHTMVGKLINDGVFVPTASGKFILGEAVRAHEKHLGSRPSSARADSQARLIELRIQETQMRIDERAGKLWNAVTVQDALLETVVAMNSRCMSVPSRYSRDRKVREDLERVIYETVGEPTLRELQEGRSKLAKLRSIGGHE